LRIEIHLWELTPVSSLADPVQTVPTERSGFWRRFAASFVDGLVLGVVSEVLRAVGIGTGSRHGIHADIVGGYGPGLLISLAYFTYFHGRTGQTPGDAALGIRVVDRESGTMRPVGYGRAAVRWAVSLVSLIPFALGYLWMLWDKENQTWHDKAAGTIVVPSRRV
jgi:uncharacterized RDD family membrane protein YckC